MTESTTALIPESSTTEPTFQEEQQFRQTWIWVLLMPISLFVIVFFSYALFSHFILGKPVGSKPMPNTLLAIMGPLFIILFGFGLPYLFFTMKLTVQVYSNILVVSFWPLRKRRILYADIASCEAVTYSPLGDYGGWGIRWGGKGKWAYNVMGDRGVQLVYKDGQKLLIGSQKAEELAAAIQKYLT